ncbi:hypothetical protein NLI96_g12354 [Meripilus lineatus]|uniref:Cytochrome P450 n=1 Tax=Meripilus lineatus TaxID=2056292 RepID=A0AAD5USH5_9APHY|nr:hypothetical protein NLI96_g12354 [Physisporinus lineatus]
MLELLGWASGPLVFLGYGRAFHDTRKIFQKQLSRQTSAIFQDNQSRQAAILAQNLLETPDKFEDHIQRFASAVVMEIAYGHHVSSPDDPYLRIADKINELVAGIGAQGSNLVDLFPFLIKLPAWFPGAWYIRYANKHLPTFLRIQRYGFDEVRKEMERGTAKPSFLSLNLEELAREGRESEEEFRRLEVSSFHLYGAGGETTKSTLHTMILALLLNPQAQKKAQGEIDKVIGVHRLPDFTDREALPYVECLMYETMRWHPAVPLGIPHRVMEDDMYEGMFIPKGSTIVPNIRSMTLDESVHKNPETFFPERYLPQPAGLGEGYPHSVFGFGRRLCPGRHLAVASVWIVLVTLLSAFDIRPVKDANGDDIIPPAEFHTALSSHPVPFKCAITPRSELARNLVLRSKE